MDISKLFAKDSDLMAMNQNNFHSGRKFGKKSSPNSHGDTSKKV